MLKYFTKLYNVESVQRPSIDIELWVIEVWRKHDLGLRPWPSATWCLAHSQLPPTRAVYNCWLLMYIAQILHSMQSTWRTTFCPTKNSVISSVIISGMLVI